MEIEPTVVEPTEPEDEDIDIDLDDEPEDNDKTDWKAEATKAKGIAKRLKTKLEKAKAESKVEKVEPVKKSEPTATGLDEMQLDYLDIKGITDQDDIDLIEKVMEKTGQTVRQTLKDDYVIAKLDANRAARAVKEATPGATKRSGGNTQDSIAAAIAKFEKTGELPKDFKTASDVVNAMQDKGSAALPPWKR